MCEAVKNRKNWSCGNTRVEVINHDCAENCWEIVVYLHDNAIYTDGNEKGEWFTLAGWDTNVTRSRLRALGIDVYTRKFEPMYKGQAINKNKWYNVK